MIFVTREAEWHLTFSIRYSTQVQATLRNMTGKKKRKIHLRGKIPILDQAFLYSMSVRVNADDDTYDSTTSWRRTKRKNKRKRTTVWLTSNKLKIILHWRRKKKIKSQNEEQYLVRGDALRLELLVASLPELGYFLERGSLWGLCRFIVFH